MKVESKSIVDFLEDFKDEGTCQKYFEGIRFRNGEYCAHCGHAKIYRFKGGRFRCAKCRQDFTIKTNTVFGESKISLKKWFIAIYLLTTSKKGISSVQLSKQVGVTQKTAWFMDHRIRRAMKQNGGQLFGDIEIDETYVGGKEKNKHRSKRTGGTQGRNTKTKTPVMGFIERKGKVKATVIEDVKMRTLEKYIINYVKFGSQIYTDDFLSYSKIGQVYKHDSVKHGKGEYVRGEAHTNSMEGFWANFKRGYYGTYHHISKKHLQRYVDEFVYRFNVRLIDFDDLFSNMVQNVSKSDKIGYKKLTTTV